MKYFLSTIGLLLLLVILSCQKEIDWAFNDEVIDLIVVDAVITNEKKQQVIILSKPYSEQNLIPAAVSGATVLLSTNDAQPAVYIALETPLGSGRYLTDSMRAVSGKIYTLLIQYNGKTYYAFASQPSVEPMDTLRYRSVSDSTYTLSLNEFGKNPNYIKYGINWQGIGDCSTPLACEAEMIFYDLKNTDTNKQFKPGAERIDFPAGTMVIRRKYSVSDDYKAFLRGMLSETAWRGGLFDAYPANVPTNLSEGAIGFFAVSTVLVDTTLIN